MARFVLLHSPFVGPSTWDELASTLARRGHACLVVDFRGTLCGAGPYYDALRAVIEGTLGEAQPSVLVAHSGAGALLSQSVLRPSDCAIYLDAVLPHPGLTWLDTVDNALAARLLKRADRGLLPPWNSWWPPGVLETMLGAHHDVVVQDCVPIPLAYVQERAPVNAAPVRSAYLQLSAAYDSESDEAFARNWPSERLVLNHFAMLTHADAVTDALITLAQRVI